MRFEARGESAYDHSWVLLLLGTPAPGYWSTCSWVLLVLGTRVPAPAYSWVTLKVFGRKVQKAIGSNDFQAKCKGEK